MATSSFRVVYYFTNAAGQRIEAYGTRQAKVTANIVQSILGTWEPDPNSIVTVLGNHNLIPAGATVAIDSVANLDKQYVDSSVLT